jgi:AcrR family transcriptional regulator
MEDIAKAAGVAKGTLCRHVSDKEDLYFGVVFGAICQLNAQLVQEAANATDPADQLRGMVRSVLMSPAEDLGVDERVDMILKSFLEGVHKHST